MYASGKNSNIKELFKEQRIRDNKERSERKNMSNEDHCSTSLSLFDAKKKTEAAKKGYKFKEARGILLPRELRQTVAEKRDVVEHSKHPAATESIPQGVKPELVTSFLPSDGGVEKHVDSSQTTKKADVKKDDFVEQSVSEVMVQDSCQYINQQGSQNLENRVVEQNSGQIQHVDQDNVEELLPADEQCQVAPKKLIPLYQARVGKHLEDLLLNREQSDIKRIMIGDAYAKKSNLPLIEAFTLHLLTGRELYALTNKFICECETVLEAKQLVENLENAQIPLNPELCSCAITRLGELDGLNEAYELYLMITGKIGFNPACLNSILAALKNTHNSQADRVILARKVFLAAKQVVGPISQTIYLQILIKFGTKPDVELFLRELGTSPTDTILLSEIINYCSTSGKGMLGGMYLELAIQQRKIWVDPVSLRGDAIISLDPVEVTNASQQGFKNVVSKILRQLIKYLFEQGNLRPGTTIIFFGNLQAFEISKYLQEMDISHTIFLLTGREQCFSKIEITRGNGVEICEISSSITNAVYLFLKGKMSEGAFWELVLRAVFRAKDLATLYEEVCQDLIKAGVKNNSVREQIKAAAARLEGTRTELVVRRFEERDWRR